MKNIDSSGVLPCAIVAYSIADEAARNLYDAEIALHIARQTRVDHWIAAASNKLHNAVLAFLCSWAETDATHVGAVDR
jgi:hypothetical protein